MAMMQPTASWSVMFYRDVNGRLPVDEWIYTLPAGEQGRVLKSIGLLKAYGVRLGMPHSRHLRGKVWELRIAAGRKDYRILYAARVGQTFILLHAFAKKTAKTPARELEIAERRLADYETRSREEKKE
jgi:phage-related protein